jgi:hypothetical protein
MVSRDMAVPSLSNEAPRVSYACAVLPLPKNGSFGEGTSA